MGTCYPGRDKANEGWLPKNGGHPLFFKEQTDKLQFFHDTFDYFLIYSVRCYAVFSDDTHMGVYFRVRNNDFGNIRIGERF